MKFLVDAMLGRLARFLRIFGYDTIYANDLEKEYGIAPISDDMLLEHALQEGRIIITRDHQFHKKAGDNSIYLTGEGIYNYLDQLKQKFNLDFNFSMNLARCSVCNSLLDKINNKEQIRQQVNDSTYQFHETFYQCHNPSCRKIFWRGSHIQKILEGLKERGIIS